MVGKAALDWGGFFVYIYGLGVSPRPALLKNVRYPLMYIAFGDILKLRECRQTVNSVP